MRWRYYLAIGAYCAFIFWMSSQSRPPGSQIDFEGADKLAHFLVYGIMAALVSAGLHDIPGRHPAWLRILGPVLFAMAYGVSDEIHQLFTPGRSYSYFDMLADGLGATAGQAFCLYRFRKRPPLREVPEQGTS